MAIPDLDWVQEHFNYLRKLGFSEEQIETIKHHDNTTEIPGYDMSRFSAYIWRSVLESDMPAAWLENTLKMLRGEKLDSASAKIEFADESDNEWKALTAAVELIEESNVDRASLLTLIRACQKNVLLQTVSFIDQGDMGSMHESDVTRDHSGSPRRFWNLSDSILDYDPLNLSIESQRAKLDKQSS